jgi:uncharacterized surface protein with fasciclin (FAS1) repeats
MASLAVLGISPAANAGEKDIVDTAVAADGFQTLVTAVRAAGLVDALKSEGPFTVFAPTDEAFGKLPKGTVESLLKDKEKLQAVLKYHVVPGKVTAAQVVKLRSADTLLGQPLGGRRCEDQSGKRRQDGHHVHQWCDSRHRRCTAA